MNRARDTSRNGDWLTRERIHLVAVALLFASAAGFLYLIVTSHGGIDLQGQPLGTDFSNVYAAGTYANEGHAASAFDPAQQSARERAIFGDTTQFYGWHYPPYFLLVAAPLARLPYDVALALWQAATLGLYLLTIWRIVSSSAPPWHGLGRHLPGGERRSLALAAARTRLSRGANQYRPRPERLSHHRAAFCASGSFVRRC